MKSKNLKFLLFFILCMVLITVTALCSGCSKQQSSVTSSSTNSAMSENVKELGNGQKQFNFIVTDLDGSQTGFLIHTDKTTVGEALIELKLISGDTGPFGLYVKTVNGITYDFETDKHYWSFYENGKMAMNGVDVTNLTDGATYEFKAE